MLFGDNYTGVNGSPDGEAVYGSMRQYWADMSKSTYRLKGKVANKDTDDVPVLKYRREAGPSRQGA